MTNSSSNLNAVLKRLATLAMPVFLGCGGGGSKPAPLYDVTINPSSVLPMVAGSSRSFNGYTSDGNSYLEWKIVEANGGRLVTWPYSNQVSYTAPAISGVYTVLATHPKDPNSKASVSIQVKASGGIWGSNGALSAFRNGNSDYWYTNSSPTVTALPNNRCLVAGGAEFMGPSLSSAVIIDFQAGDRLGVESPTGSMSQARTAHSATLLADGRVLVAGGASSTSILSSVEIFNPATGTFSPGPAMSLPRIGHQATLLPNGKVLFTGGLTPGGPWNGTNNNNPTGVVELFDPALNGGQGGFVAGPSLVHARFWHSATVLPGGKVLIAGGVTGPDKAKDVSNSVELWDPAQPSVEAPAGLIQARSRHGAILLTSGKVLLAGGYIPDPSFIIKGLSSAELFDPATGQFQTTGSMRSERYAFGIVPLTGGKVMVIAGGHASGGADVFDPGTGLFRDGGYPGEMWQTQTTTAVLGDGRVVAMGMPYNVLYTGIYVYYP